MSASSTHVIHSASRTALVVAPYSPAGSCERPHHGAANKISSVVGILRRCGYDVTLVNSAHNAQTFRGARTSTLLFGGEDVPVFEPATLGSRKVGKLLQLGLAGHYARSFARRTPALVWVYNGYAFEASFAIAMKDFVGSKIVLELEDWPTARHRGGLNIKPRIDLALYRRLVERADLVTCVNDELRAALDAEGRPTFLLPSIIKDEVLLAAAARPPFAGVPLRVGYFGGLSAEKGADVVLAAFQNPLPGWELAVTGGGPLQGDFEALARKHPGVVTFEANVPNDRLYSLMGTCDVILNPHKPIEAMANGIFPFKVFEGLASRRLVISTALPACGFDLGQAVLFFDGTPAGLIAALEQARRFHERARDNVEALAAAIVDQYAESALATRLGGKLGELV